MRHAGTQTIRTPRLVMRRCRVEDARSMYRNWASDSRVTCYLPWDNHPTVEASRTVLTHWAGQYDQPDYYHWMVTLEEEPIGTLGLYDVEDNWQCCEMGYCYGRPWWGMGYATEAARAALDYIFTRTDMYRVTAVYDERNPGSGRVMQKLGMTYEGTMRAHRARKEGGRSDAHIYGILRPEWESQGKQET